MNLPVPLGPGAGHGAAQQPLHTHAGWGAPGVGGQGGPGGQFGASSGGAFGGPIGGISAEQKLELLEYWRSVVKRKWAIIVLGLLVALVAAVISYALTPVYRTSATLLIEAGKGKIVSIEEVYSVAQQRDHYQTQIEILKSREVAERTARALKLWQRPEFDPRRSQPGWRAKLLSAIGLVPQVVKTEWTEDELVKAASGVLMDTLSVVPVRGSQLVLVQVESTNPMLAAELANAVSQQYIESERDERYQLTQQVSLQLQERLADLRQKLSESERALQTYREQRGIVAWAARPRR
jgi:polysaccharide biosynthesis transport protein